MKTHYYDYANSYGTMKVKTGVDNIVVYYDKVNQWLFLSCANQLTLGEARKHFGECLELIAKHHCSRIIIDGYAVKPSRELADINGWLTSEWLPAASEHGLRYVAQLQSTESDVRLFEGSAVHAAHSMTHVQSFSSLVNAVRWLYEQ